MLCGIAWPQQGNAALVVFKTACISDGPPCGSMAFEATVSSFVSQPLFGVVAEGDIQVKNNLDAVPFVPGNILSNVAIYSGNSTGYVNYLFGSIGPKEEAWTGTLFGVMTSPADAIGFITKGFKSHESVLIELASGATEIVSGPDFGDSEFNLGFLGLIAPEGDPIKSFLFQGADYGAMNGAFYYRDAASIPEPSTSTLLLAGGLMCLVVALNRRREWSLHSKLDPFRRQLEYPRLPRTTAQRSAIT